MKKTLITLAVLAGFGVANAATITLDNISSTTPFFSEDDVEMTNYTASDHALSYSFSFTLVGEIETDTVVAAYWTDHTNDIGVHAFVIDSDTMTLNVGLGSFKADGQKGSRNEWNNWTWYKDATDRYGSFGDVALTVGTTYHVELTNNTGGAEVATLTWEGGSATANYRGYMNSSGAAGSAVVAEVGVVPEPATASLSLLGLAALMMRRRRA